MQAALAVQLNTSGDFTNTIQEGRSCKRICLGRQGLVGTDDENMPVNGRRALV